MSDETTESVEYLEGRVRQCEHMVKDWQEALEKAREKLINAKGSPLTEERRPWSLDDGPVRVVWQDSVQPCPNWHFLQDFNFHSAPVATTVGFVLNDDGNTLWVAPTITDQIPRQVVGAAAIAWRQIVSIEKLTP